MKKINNVVAILLAAGKGTRMNSSLPKVLHTIAGKPIITEIVDIIRSIGIERVIAVIGHQSDLVKQHLRGIETVEQRELLGTAHAVAQTQERLKGFEGDILISNGDTPFITPRTLEKIITHHKYHGASCTLLTAEVHEPFGYGRVVRDVLGRVVDIVEERNASPYQRFIKEVNVGVYCFQRYALFRTLKQIKPEGEKGEYYLTAAISLLTGQGERVESVATDNHYEALGVNTKDDLTRAQMIAKAVNANGW